MIVEPAYRGFRIQIDAELVDGVWNARVRIRRTLSEEKPRVETVTCQRVLASPVAVRVQMTIRAIRPRGEAAG